ncbi:MAG: DUF4395 domain-containing protein [Campylobacteraceae bacterium]|nr:DUF4395 domain-containing protein [Campylobacteraceae bacterium]
MGKFLSFGENIEAYNIKVLNEREIRASAGIMFLFAIISFLNSWLIGNFLYTKIFVIVFTVDFFIRIFINPKYAPSLIIGRLMVRNQQVEYIGAPQKRFAWFIGFVLAVIMFYLIVLNNVIGPINLFVCLTCLILLFFEAAFGICLGCKIYNLFHTQKAKLCPGNSCESIKRAEIQKTGITQFAILIVSAFLLYGVWNISLIHKSYALPIKILDKQTNKKTINKECTPPQWAIDIGHAEKWKLHHGCK